MPEIRQGSEETIEDKSLGQLVSLVSTDMSQLVRSEIELAKLELAADAKRAGKGAGLFGGAGFLGYFALIFLSIALAVGISAAGLPLWLGFLIVGGLYVVLAAALGLIGFLNVRSITGARHTRVSVREGIALLRRRGSAS